MASKVAIIWYKIIIASKGEKTLEDVPEKYREEVQELMNANENKSEQEE